MTTPLLRVALDFETYYDQEYSLRRMTTAEYIRDARFEPIGFGLSMGGLPASWFSGSVEYLSQVLARIPWGRVELVAHNAIFDGAILEWICGYKPAKYLCTMMGTRPYVAPAKGSTALGIVLPYLGLGQKGTEVHNAVGMHRADFSAEQLQRYGEYCCGDTNGTNAIAHWLDGKLPEVERDLIDLTIKKFTRPQLQIDTSVCVARVASLEAEREAALADPDLKALGVTRSTLTSRPKFAALLQARGVEPPTKVSPATEEETLAFSKQDLGFLELLTHDDPVVPKLVRTRLLFSSSQEQTRLQRFRAQAALTPDQWMAVPLLYYAAHTGRMGGFDSLNLQNLPRPDKKHPGREALRAALVAPPGQRVLAGDLSNIEARLVAALAGQANMVQRFAAGEDLYAWYASKLYGWAVNKKDHPDERFLGKEVILGCGYGLGYVKFHQRMALKGVSITEQGCKKAVYFYRELFDRIPGLWSHLEACLVRCTDPTHLSAWGPLTFCHERIVLPNGMAIWYPGLRIEPGQGLGYDHPRYGFKTLWGGHITENVCQALAKIILASAEVRIAKHGLRAALQVHDELVFVVPTTHVESCRLAVEKALTAPVPWMPTLPLACEVKYGQSYAEAK